MARAAKAHAWALVVLACITWPVSGRAGDGAAADLAAILGRRSPKALDARFRQTKRIALLRDPLVSSGRVRFEPPDGMRWEVVSPEPLVVDTRDGVVRAGPPGALEEVPEGLVGALPGGFSGVFGATTADIAAAFDVARAADRKPGAFRLTPNEPAMARLLERIDLELDPETGLPRRVVLYEAGGDSSEIEIFP